MASGDRETLPSTRLRSLSERGREQYLDRKDSLFSAVLFSREGLQKCVSDIFEHFPRSVLNIQQAEGDLTVWNDRYIASVNRYIDYISHFNTSESIFDLETFQNDADHVNLKNKIGQLFDRLESDRLVLLETASQFSGVSSRSSRKSVLAARKRAEAEGVRTKLLFASKESSLKHELERVQASLERLQQEKELAAKEAEADYLEEYDGKQNSNKGSSFRPPSETFDPTERTSQYVESVEADLMTEKAPNEYSHNVGMAEQGQTAHVTSGDNNICNPWNSPPVSVPLIHHNAAIPEGEFSMPEINNNAKPSMKDTAVARFLCRKDVLKDRLQSFSGKCEHYVAWKDTFKCVIGEIEANASEELDLLIRWAGPGARQIISIKAANSGNSTLGLTRAWNRLDTHYGSPEKIEQALREKLRDVPRITFKDKSKFYDLSDVLSEVLAIKEKSQYQALLSYLDTSVGVNPIICKLPPFVQGRWRDRAITYKRTRNVLFPPFTFFCEFIRDMAAAFNDPSFEYDVPQTNSEVKTRTSRAISVAKTSADVNAQPIQCLIHKGLHPLADCRVFRHKALKERRELLKKEGLCFKCCAGKHLARSCEQPVNCNECQSQSHTTAMHLYQATGSVSVKDHGGEHSTDRQPAIEVDSKCTELCNGQLGRSCAKIVLVNIRHLGSDCPPLRTYAIIDDQSNCSLARSALFDYFHINTAVAQYSLKGCAGSMRLSGRQTLGFVIESLDGQESFEVPFLTECDMIPDNRGEIPAPDVALLHPHLASIACDLPPIDPSADILLLIGRDLMAVHHVLEQRLGGQEQPFAQRLRLGWVIIGECCLDGVHVPREIGAMKTFVHSNGRPTGIPFESCDYTLECDLLFRKTENDNLPALSWEDKQFLQLMSTEMMRGTEGNWIAPLPFKYPRPVLPKNRHLAVHRTQNFLASLNRDPVKREHTLKFMQALFDNGHAEEASAVKPSEEVWYLPLFGVYHPKKRDKIRIVFDSAAEHGGLSLNSVLMSGPNLMNNLVGVLMRFRRDRVAIMADIKQMFYSFQVRMDHRNYLRFVWPEKNDLTRDLVDYRMRVHVFGNKPSPAVAILGLQKTADIAEPLFGPDIRNFVHRNFYVDDGLSSHPTCDEAVRILKGTQEALKQCGNLYLHKICSSSQEVLEAFEKDDLAGDIQNLDLEKDFPLQRTLGVYWDVKNDVFTFNITTQESENTKRGILSTINGLYDPLGLVAPFTIIGKLLMREGFSGKLEWDEQLSFELLNRWQAWKDSLKILKDIQVPRLYCSIPTHEISCRDLFVYSDASEKAVASVAYLVCHGADSERQVGFVVGKSKVAPKHGHTIPRLELCAAVLAVDVYELCRKELDISFDRVCFFTDSKVVLGYVYNETKRFYVYVANRIDRIRSVSNPYQWFYVPSALNPADDATRGIAAGDLPGCKWLQGSSHTLSFVLGNAENSETYPLILPDEDNEVRTLTTKIQKIGLGCKRFERFSSWASILRGVSFIKRCIHFRNKLHELSDLILIRKQAQVIVIREFQSESFSEEIQALEKNKAVPKNSSIHNLSPFVDDEGVLRVGGRLANSCMEPAFINPIIVPRSHLSQLLVSHFHSLKHHQGRTITEGAIRSAGFWLISGKRQIANFIQACIKCRKLRGTTEHQKTADLPSDRINPTPPFTNIGIDVFGPWEISTRKTRGGHANSKRWALIFSCLVIRAVHIELLEEMTSSCFINALRRFCSFRGEVHIIRSDCGTNFVGSTGDLSANVINIGERPIKDYLVEHGINWIFNPPHSSHFGGSWERMIGVSRRILESILSSVKCLSHDTLNTLMAEVCCIINARPLTAVSDDPDVPYPLSPATLLTLKSNQIVSSFQTEDFNDKDLYKSQWRQVQRLADIFWTRWKKEYISSLQPRRKWHDEHRSMAVGDVVLLRDKAEHRNEWPLGIVNQVHLSDDGRVRSVDIRLGKVRKIYSRPVNELVLLLPIEKQ